MMNYFGKRAQFDLEYFRLSKRSDISDRLVDSDCHLQIIFVNSSRCSLSIYRFNQKIRFDIVVIFDCNRLFSARDHVYFLDSGQTSSSKCHVVLNAIARITTQFYPTFRFVPLKIINIIQLSVT